MHDDRFPRLADQGEIDDDRPSALILWLLVSAAFGAGLLVWVLL